MSSVVPPAVRGAVASLLRHPVRFGLLAAVLAAGAGALAWGGDDAADQPAFTLSSVTSGPISQSITVSGTAELVNEQAQRFTRTGRVTAVHVRAGQSVAKDTVIAEIDNEPLQLSIRQAELSLQNSRITLQNLLDGATAAEETKARTNIADTQRRLEVAQKNLEVARSTSATTIASLDRELALAQADVESKQNALTLAKQSLENTLVYQNQDVTTADTTYSNTLTNALSLVKNILDDTDNHLATVNSQLSLEGTQKNVYVSYAAYLGATDTAAKDATTLAFDRVRAGHTALAAQLAAAGSQPGRDAAQQLLQAANGLLAETLQLADGYNAMLKGTITGTNLTDSSLQSLRSGASSMRSSVVQRQDSVRSAIAGITGADDSDTTRLRSSETISQKQDTVQSAQIALDRAQSTYRTAADSISYKKEQARLTVTSAENEIASLQGTLRTQQDDLEDLLDGADEADIAKARNDVATREVALQQARSDVTSYQIIAPFDGVVRKIDYQVGDNLLSDDDKYVYLENPNLLRITTMLDQVDIVQVKEGQKADITFDALPMQKFAGIVESVDETPVTSSGVVTYQVNITVDKGENRILSGMTAGVDIILQASEQALLVPSSAVRSALVRVAGASAAADGQRGTRSARVATGGTTDATSGAAAEDLATTTDTEAAVGVARGSRSFVTLADGTERAVTTGITSGSQTEILSGLSIGDEVRVPSYTSSAASSSSSASFGGTRAAGFGSGMGGSTRSAGFGGGGGATMVRFGG